MIGVIEAFDDENRNGGFFLTDKRIICICNGLGLGTKTSDFPYSNISSIDFNSGFLKSKVTIHVSGNTSEYTVHDKELANKIVKFVREILVEKNDVIVESSDNQDVFTQIEKLSSLKEKGILTEEEFNNKKAELLKKI